jgi:RNA-directed DNA polymerase
VSLVTPEKILKLQRTLYGSAKKDPERRFHQVYDKVYREDIFAHAYRLARSNGGAPGVDEMTFEVIETQGRQDWLEGLRDELRTKTYEPSPVRRVMIPKQGGGERPLGIPTIRGTCAILTQSASRLRSGREAPMSRRPRLRRR